MNSTEIIHQIIENHGSEDNRQLMIDLKALRIEVVSEVSKRHKAGQKLSNNLVKNLYR